MIRKLCCEINPFYSCDSCGVQECRSCVFSSWKIHDSGIEKGCPITGKRVQVNMGPNTKDGMTLHFYEP